MKKLFKHFIRFSAAMSLCAIVLAETPPAGTPDPGTVTNEPQNMNESGEDNSPENEPGIAPQNDLEPKLTDKS